MLSQLLVLFGFFSLVLVAVFWINRAVVLFDRLIGDGQTALVFLEFSALGMPKLISTVLPLSTFAAAVYVTNRLNNESELTVVQAAGIRPIATCAPDSSIRNDFSTYDVYLGKYLGTSSASTVK